ncbi:MAG: SCP2 sterol-binding domain-containing protein [Legionellales bacterium]|nr:SCP2 sterol-binding domain-containing protein [Legionellales bacterium]
MDNKNNTKPFSIVSLMSSLTSPLIPRPLIQKTIDILTNSFVEMHPNVIQRMAEFSPAIMILDPIDLPFSFLTEFTKNDLKIIIVDDDKYMGNDITKISAPIGFFLNMLEGEKDGDALFFSRQLTVEGDTTIIVALRNILEAESVNINQDIDEKFSSFGKIIHFVKNLVSFIVIKSDQNLDQIKKSIVGDLQAQTNLHNSKIKDMEAKLKTLEKQKELLSNKLQSMRLKLNKGKPL